MVKVSALKVRVFEQCRLRYRYQYLQGGGRPRLRPSDTAGSLVHRVLCDIFTKTAVEERTTARLMKLFEEGWAALSRRYLRIPGVDEYYEASLRQLSNFAGQFGLADEPFMVEPYLQVEVTRGVTLFGRLDRLDEDSDGTLHIIDYKAGSMPGDIDPGQLIFYAILVEAKLPRRVSKASFWYLDDGTTWTLDLSEEGKVRAREELLITVQQMQEATEFPPTIDLHCGSCPFLHACEVRDVVAVRRASEGW